MALVDDLLDLLPTSATWEPAGNRNAYGAPNYGTPVPIANARLVESPKLVRDAAGDEVVSTAQLWLDGYYDVSPQDRVTLADGSRPVIASVGHWMDETGARHTKVFFR